MQRSRVSAVLALAALAACSDADVGPAAAPAETQLAPFATARAVEDVVPGEVLVKMRDGSKLEEVAAVHGTILARLGHRGSFGVMRAQPGAERALASRLSEDPRVE